MNDYDYLENYQNRLIEQILNPSFTILDIKINNPKLILSNALNQQKIQLLINQINISNEQIRSTTRILNKKQKLIDSLWNEKYRIDFNRIQL